ncbi:MAG: glycosyltransferase, partial [Candidatus Eiseniibacteriota bacterium]
MASAPRSILVVINALGPGGAERVATILANAWAERGDRVSVATFTDPGTAPFFELDLRVQPIAMGVNGAPGPFLGRLGALGRNVARVRAIRRAIRESAATHVLSYMNVTNVLAIAGAAGTGVPVVATEHIDPSQDDIGSLWTALRRLAYPHAARLAVLSERVLDYFPPDIRAKSVVVPNPVLPPPPAAPGAPTGPFA